MASALLTRSAGLDAACCKGEILILVVAELLSSARSIGFVEPVGTSPFCGHVAHGSYGTLLQVLGQAHSM